MCRENEINKTTFAKGDFKTRAVIEPIILEPKSFIIESANGKKLEIINAIDSNKWIYKEFENFETDNSLYKGQACLIMVLIVLLWLLFARVFRGDFLTGIILGVAVFLCGIMLFMFQYVPFYKRYQKFILAMRNGEFQEDMEKSIRSCKMHYYIQEKALYYLSLCSKRIIYISITDKEGEVSLKVMTGDINGDVFTEVCNFLPLYNLNLEHPQITIHPEGINLKLPMKLKEEISK